MERNPALKVIIIGCGLGGLACAIACRREGLEVTVLEKATALSEIGAGIQLPPNATRIMSQWGLMDKIYAAGAVEKEENFILRWRDGRVLTTRPGKDWPLTGESEIWLRMAVSLRLQPSQQTERDLQLQDVDMGSYNSVMHRADYQRVLHQEVLRLGAEVRLGVDVVGIDCNDELPEVRLSGGEQMLADVIVGADGLRSVVRTSVLGRVNEPEESGDLAYRITIPRERLANEADPFLRSIVTKKTNGHWWGPNMHVVLYGIRNDQLANLVLICPDDLPPQTNKEHGDLAEMRARFEKWDPRLQLLLSKVNEALKWKVYSMKDLDVWVKGSVALLGDACHPSVPYAASGAAMAVEDGATLGRLLGHFSQSSQSKSRLPDLLRLYERVRKQRAQTTVQTADSNRGLYHMEDGVEQEERDRLFSSHDWWDEKRPFPWKFADLAYLHELHGFDAILNADEAFASTDFGR